MIDRDIKLSLFFLFESVKKREEPIKIPPFPKLYRLQFRSGYVIIKPKQSRIFALSDGCHRKLINDVYKIIRLSPIGVGGSHFYLWWLSMYVRTVKITSIKVNISIVFILFSFPFPEGTTTRLSLRWL